MAKTKRPSSDQAVAKDIRDSEDVIYKALLFGPGEAPPESQQLDTFSEQSPEEYIKPPFQPELWAAAMEQSTRLARAIRTYARNTVGMGWYIEPCLTITNRTTPEEKQRIETQTAAATKLFNRPNPKMPFVTLAFLTKVDQEATGNGYIEVTRNGFGNIDGLWHAPATTVRIRKGGKGFIQIVGQTKRYFKEFGDRRIMHAQNGVYLAEKVKSLLTEEEITQKTPEGARMFPGDQAIPKNVIATEMLHFRIYSPRSSHYGVPRYVAASPAISGNRLAGIRNVVFFENDATPRLAVMVSGGRLAGESVEMLERFLSRKMKGVGNSHRVVVLQTEPKKVGFGKESKTNITLQPLTVGVTEDASFLQYRAANDDEIREAFGISEVFFKSENVNKAAANVSREVTNEQEFEPERLEWEFIFNACVMTDLFGADGMVSFKFERPALTDPLDTAKIDQVYASLGALTPNELRDSMGKPRFPDEYLFANKPMAVAMQEMAMGIALAINRIQEAAVVGAVGADGLPVDTPDALRPLPADTPEALRGAATGKPAAPTDTPAALMTPAAAQEIIASLIRDARDFALGGLGRTGEGQDSWVSPLPKVKKNGARVLRGNR